MLCAQKSNKSLSRQGSGHFSFERVVRAVPFPPQDLVVHVNLSRPSHNAVDMAGSQHSD